MPLTKAQAENFVQAFFRDHRLAAPPIGTRRNFRVTLARRKRLNLPRTITRQALADQVAARLCRECGKIQSLKVGKKRYRFSHHFSDWKTYVRGVIVRHFGHGDGLQ